MQSNPHAVLVDDAPAVPFAPIPDRPPRACAARMGEDCRAEHQVESESKSISNWSLSQTTRDDEMINGVLPVQGEGITLTIANPLSVWYWPVSSAAAATTVLNVEPGGYSCEVARLSIGFAWSHDACGRWARKIISAACCRAAASSALISGVFIPPPPGSIPVWNR